MPAAKKHDTVRVNYTGKLNDGSVFDSSQERDPLQFKLGAGEVIPGFENAVIGMETGAKKTITIGVDKAYGPHRDDLVVKVSKKQLPEDLKPEVGQQLAVNLKDDRQALVTVTDIGEEEITIDANHPLAGQSLTFEIELLSIDS